MKDKITLPQVPNIELPALTVIPWNGPIPDGWLLCDGSHDTPDLRHKFIPKSAELPNGSEHLRIYIQKKGA